MADTAEPAGTPDGAESSDRPGGVDAGQRTGHRVLALVEVMDVLRRECPWDRDQTHDSLAKYLIEEAYEALETIEGGRLDALREELGDVLLQVVFHARVAEERGTEGFTIDDVADSIVAKLVRRHPHVFADTTVRGTEDVRANWETIKATERAERGEPDSSILDGVPFGQPAALLTSELAKRAVRNGLPADLIGDDGGPGGEVLAAVEAERRRGADPETDLRSAARRLDARVREAESKARSDGLDPRQLTEEQWREYWT